MNKGETLIRLSDDMSFAEWRSSSSRTALRTQDIPGAPQFVVDRRRTGAAAPNSRNSRADDLAQELMVDRVGIGHVVTGRDDEVPFAADHTLVEIDIERRPFVHDDYGIYGDALGHNLVPHRIDRRADVVAAIRRKVDDSAVSLWGLGQQLRRVVQRHADRRSARGDDPWRAGEERAQRIGVGIARNDAPWNDDHLLICVRPLNGRDRNLAMRSVADRFLDISLVKCVAQSLHLLAELIGVNTERDVDGEDNGGINRRLLRRSRIWKGEAQKSEK